MYSNFGYTPGSEISNNPFVSDPTNAQTRFPDIGPTSTISSPLQSAPAGQYAWSSMPAAVPTGYLNQAQPPGSPLGPQQQQQHFSFDAAFQLGQQPLASPTTTTVFSQPFQPSSAFGQQLFGSSYGYLQGANAPGPENLSVAQQQIRNNPGYVAQFDPYSAIRQGWDGAQSQGSGYGGVGASQATSPTRSAFSSLTSSSTTNANANRHPRDYIRTHKAELESWDTYAWKQLFNTFDALKDAWSARAQELRGQVEQVQAQIQYATASGAFFVGQVQQELARVQTMANDANSNTDSVTASLFQMKEVYAGYRQSGDPASKRRVRESCNAALQSLPEWPQQQQQRMY